MEPAALIPSSLPATSASLASESAASAPSAPSVPAPVLPRSLLSLPDECLASIWECLSTFDLLRALLHPPPCKSWAAAWHALPSFDVDLERDVGHVHTEQRAAAAATATAAGAGTAINNAHPSSAPLASDVMLEGGNLYVAGLLARKRADYTQLVRLLAAHARELQSIRLAHFGSALTDMIPAGPATDATQAVAHTHTHQEATPAVASSEADAVALVPAEQPESLQGAAPLSFRSILHSHRASLTSLSLTGCELRRLDLGPEFAELVHLDLARSRSLQDPRLALPALRTLDLSRTLLNDFELLKLLPRLSSLRTLRLASCKNLRMLVPEDAKALYGRGGLCPELKIVDLSNTHVVDASVTALAKQCSRLEALYLTDCKELRAPRIVSASLQTLSLRGCKRLKSNIVILCPRLTELDLSRCHLRDEHFNGGGERGGVVYVPYVRVLLMSSCGDIVNPSFRVDNPLVARELQEMEEARKRAEEQDRSSLDGPSAASISVVPLQSFPHLSVLDVSFTFDLSNQALHALLSAAPQVEVLNIQMCKEVRPTWSESHAIQGPHGPAQMQEQREREDVFPEGLSQLRELYAGGTWITDKNISLLLDSTAGASLSVLQLRNCVNITGAGIHGPALTELDLRQTPLTDSLLADLLQPDRCPNLRSLAIAQCAELVHPRVAHGELRVLDVSNCAALTTLVVAAPQLHQLDASLCFSLARCDVSDCPSLTALNVQHSSMVAVQAPVHRSTPSSVLAAGGSSPAVRRGSGGPLLLKTSLSSSSPARKGRSLQGGAGAIGEHDAQPSIASSSSSSSATSTASYDALPIHAHLQRAQLTALPPTHQHGVMHTPPRRPSIGGSHDSHGGAAAAASVSAASFAAASAASAASPSSSTPSTPASLPARTGIRIRGIDLAVSEERVRELEAKLAAAQQAQQRASGSAAPVSVSSNPHTPVTVTAATCYGLKKQLAVARAQLKKEQMRAAAAHAQEAAEEAHDIEPAAEQEAL